MVIDVALVHEQFVPAAYVTLVITPSEGQEGHGGSVVVVLVVVVVVEVMVVVAVVVVVTIIGTNSKCLVALLPSSMTTSKFDGLYPDA